MSNRPLNRRKFTALCAASLVSAIPLGASAQNAPTAKRTVKFRDGRTVPALGQGSARLTRGGPPEAAVIKEFRTGTATGRTLTDTAERYASKELTARAISGKGEKVFLGQRCGRRMWPATVSRVRARR